MARRNECPIERNLPQVGPPWQRWGNGLFYFLCFCVAGTVALLWALGYRVNWQAQTIEQTSIIQVSSPQAGIQPEVYVNGVKQETSLPLTLRFLFPGRYDVVVREDGYTTWQKNISVGPNERVSYPGVLMLYEAPRTIEVPNVRTDEIVSREYDNKGIEIRSANELWVDGQFITRTSGDMFNAEYFFDTKHVVYQAGDELIMRDLIAGTSEMLVKLSTKTPVPYVTQENGRVLVYLDGELLKAVALYQSTSIIDRLGGTR